MPIKYIYPSWIRAKLNLATELNLNEKQKSTLDKWFRNHCFEFGAATAVSERQMMNPDYKKVVEHHVARSNLLKIVECLASKGLVQQNEIESDDYTRRYETRILVFGVPTLGVDKEYREQPEEKKDGEV